MGIVARNYFDVYFCDGIKIHIKIIASFYLDIIEIINARNFHLSSLKT